MRVETVGAVALPGSARYSGTVLARTQVEVAFRSGGYVASIATVNTVAGLPVGAGDLRRTLQAGDRVQRGMVLASLRQSDYRQRVSEAAAMSNEASASHRNAEVDYKRARKLLTHGAISKAEFGTTKARYDALKGSVVAAAARAGQTRLILRDTQLRSPLAGIVLDRAVEVGTLVAPGAPVFVVADTSVVRVSFAVPDNVQSTLSLGGRMTATTDAAPDRVFSGVISKIAAQADPKTRTFDVEVSIDNPQLILKVGLIATVQTAPTRTEDEVLCVPLGAVVQDPKHADGFTVFVVNQEHGVSVARARSVQLGKLTGNGVTVTRGIGIGEWVVVQGSTLVTDGSRVNLVASTGAPPQKATPLPPPRLVTAL